MSASSEPRGGLDPQTLAIVRIAVATATGDETKLRDRMVAARAMHVPPPWIDELLLQSFLNVGYPLALVAFGVWHGMRGGRGGPGGPGGRGAARPHGDGAEQLAHEDWESWAVRGAAVCRAVYGRAYHKLLVNLRALHPALEDLVLVDAYGKVIGRPGLDLKRRELCTVAAIAVLGTAQQLHSHLRGALNTGATVTEIEAVLGVIDGDLDPEHRTRAREQWEDVKGRKL